MKLGGWLQKRGMTKLKFNVRFLEMEWEPKDPDMNAAWELYVELLTRIATQRLRSSQGDEETALTSVYKLFAITREIMRRNGRGCIQFARIAIIVLNQIVRPFTAKWHKLSLAEAFKDSGRCQEFRTELEELQRDLVTYTKMLADMAGVEDLTQMEDKS